MHVFVFCMQVTFSGTEGEKTKKEKKRRPLQRFKRYSDQSESV